LLLIIRILNATIGVLTLAAYLGDEINGLGRPGASNTLPALELYWLELIIAMSRQIDMAASEKGLEHYYLESNHAYRRGL
jgi:hypothetical protein